MAKSSKTKSKLFSDAEMAAMQETKAERKRKGNREEGLKACLAKIREMKGSDREQAEKIHAIVTSVAPALAPTTWYGMPAYANESGKAVCFFTPALKFKSRYASFGFNEFAKLDDGNMWATAFAVVKIGEAEEKKIAAMVKKAAG